MDDKVIPTFLNFEEFCAIDFGLHPNERPDIFNDMVSYLTGTTFVNDVRKAIDPAEEINKRTVVFPTAGTDEELQNYKESMSELNYKSVEKAFKRLYGNGQFSESDTDGVPFLTERNFT